jgi:hypothetical protein
MLVPNGLLCGQSRRKFELKRANPVSGVWVLLSNGRRLRQLTLATALNRLAVNVNLVMLGELSPLILTPLAEHQCVGNLTIGFVLASCAAHSRPPLRSAESFRLGTLGWVPLDLSRYKQAVSWFHGLVQGIMIPKVRCPVLCSS